MYCTFIMWGSKIGFTTFYVIVCKVKVERVHVMHAYPFVINDVLVEIIVYMLLKECELLDVLFKLRFSLVFYLYCADMCCSLADRLFFLFTWWRIALWYTSGLFFSWSAVYIYTPLGFCKKVKMYSYKVIN